MSRHSTLKAVDLLPPRPNEALYRRVYRTLREAVLSGELAPRARVPSSRELARTWSVARNTVLEAVEMLVAEGYLVTREASGTFVAELIERERRAPPQEASPPLALSSWARRAIDARPNTDGGKFDVDFRLGRVPTQLFPSDAWAEALARRAPELRFGGYGDELGPLPAREALAAYLTRERGVHVMPDRLMLTSGSQGSLDALARVMLELGRVVAMEDPGYVAARRVFEASGATVVPVPVDDGGLIVEALPKRATLLYTTPAHQFPTGAAMSAERRLRVLEWARSAGAWIVEDDYNSEFRYGARPLTALQGLAPHAVIFVGTFSKSLAPALRSGYLVAPRDVVATLARARALTDRQPPTLDALALADFLESGAFARHLRAVRDVAEARANTLLRALEAHLPSWRPTATGAGLHLHVALPRGSDEEAVRSHAASVGVGVSVTSQYGELPRAPGVLLAFAHLPEHRIREGVERLAVSQEMNSRASQAAEPPSRSST